MATDFLYYNLRTPWTQPAWLKKRNVFTKFKQTSDLFNRKASHNIFKYSKSYNLQHFVLYLNNKEIVQDGHFFMIFIAKTIRCIRCGIGNHTHLKQPLREEDLSEIPIRSSPSQCIQHILKT